MATLLFGLGHPARDRASDAQLGRRRAILEALLQDKAGLTADALARRLGVTRSAAHQQLATLERDGLVARRKLAPTRGRPSLVFALTRDGENLFPKRYDLMAELLLETLHARLGSEEAGKALDELGASLAKRFAGEIPDGPALARLEAVAALMERLGYAARVIEGPDGAPEIQAFNCIYHHLAAAKPEVCRLDIALLEGLIGAPVGHAECMVRGGGSCRFRPAATPAAGAAAEAPSPPASRGDR